MKKLRIKDFEIKSFYYGSRLTNGPEWAYKIIYHNPNGQNIQLNKICYRKKDAENYIRETIKIANQINKERNNKNAGSCN